MKVCIQRVAEASVSVEGESIGSIGRGLLILVGVKVGDSEKEAKWLASKCASLRIFEDENGKMNLSCSDIGGQILVVTNFTLYADCSHGRRPSFIQAELPDKAKPLTDYFIQCLRDTGVKVQTGRFGADMKVNLLNDGPITIIIDSSDALPGSKL